MRTAAFLPACAALVFAVSLPARAQGPDALGSFIEDYVAARALEKRCPRWRVNEVAATLSKVRLKIGDDDFEVGGKHHTIFMERARHYGKMFATGPRDQACAAAEMMFGPKGVIHPDWMRTR